jgi:putative ABC transport system ATP-binding protein
MNSECYLCIEQLTKSYLEGSQRRIILDHADASFPTGEFTAILGRSGSGKSTLLNLIGGIDLADQGRIWFNGRDLTILSERERTLFRRNNIGFIFQFFNLIPTLTVLENILLPAELAGKNRAEGRRSAFNLLSEVGLSERADTFPDRLSGGEQQRVAIARALINDPAIILADEPTGNLDETTGKTVLDLLDRLTRQLGRNLVMVTHSRTAAAYANRILMLQAGKLDSVASVESILT